MKLTEEQVIALEQSHNVWINRDTQQFNVGGGYEAEYGWMIIPDEWREEVEEF